MEFCNQEYIIPKYWYVYHSNYWILANSTVFSLYIVVNNKNLGTKRNLHDFRAIPCVTSHKSIMADTGENFWTANLKIFVDKIV